MASHNELGQEAEAMAVTWLIENGFTIMHRNWRYSRYEIDIIAFKKDFLHFIEVKARKSSRFGNPEDSVRKKKFRDLQRAADAFLYQHPGYKWIQYDILAITLNGDLDHEYFFIEDVYL